MKLAPVVTAIFVVVLLLPADAAADKKDDVPVWDLGARVLAGYTLGQQSPGILVGAAGIFRYKFLAGGVFVEGGAVNYDLETRGLLAGAAFQQPWYRLELLASGGKHTYRNANDSIYDLGGAGVDGEKYFVGIRGSAALAILTTSHLRIDAGPWVAFEDDFSRTTGQFTPTGGAGDRVYEGTVGDRRFSFGLALGAAFNL